MPPPRAGRALIWLVLCFLCAAVFVGGGFLVAYVVLPESQSSSWYGMTGLTLVCLPWLFWFLTFFYRLVSRACGIRLGHPVADDSVVASNNVADGGARSSDDNNERSTMNKSSGGKRVHFGEAVVVNENEKDGSGRGEMSGTTRSSTSSRSSRSNGSDESVEMFPNANVI